jgi:hypothetical protein
VVDGQAEFFGQRLVLLVVVAVLAAGVLDAAGGGQGVGGFVQQGAQDGTRVAAQPLAADEDFGQGAGVMYVPPPRGEVAPCGDPAAGPAGDDDDRGRDLGMPGADGLPAAFQGGNDRADRLGPLAGEADAGPVRLGGQPVLRAAVSVLFQLQSPP